MRRAGVLLALAVTLGGCAAQRQVLLGRPGTPPVAVDPPSPPGVPPAMAWLYGSGEAAALSEQAYTAWARSGGDVLSTARDRRGRLPSQRRAGTLPRWPASAVLAPGATAATAETLPCGTLPPAVVLDMDETAVLNLGYEYDDGQHPRAFEQKRWERWEQGGADKVVAVPGAVAAFRALRGMGVTMIVNTNRSAANAAQTARALSNAGLGAFTHGETLFLKGDVDGRSGKDGRRAAIAAKYCVVALAGDQLGDFADLFNPPGPAPAIGRRMLTAVAPIEARWGSGWFMLPNPVYGTGLGTGWDETFPQDKRWSDRP